MAQSVQFQGCVSEVAYPLSFSLVQLAGVNAFTLKVITEKSQFVPPNKQAYCSG